MGVGNEQGIDAFVQALIFRGGGSRLDQVAVNGWKAVPTGSHSTVTLLNLTGAGVLLSLGAVTGSGFTTFTVQVDGGQIYSVGIPYGMSVPLMIPFNTSLVVAAPNVSSYTAIAGLGRAERFADYTPAVACPADTVHQAYTVVDVTGQGYVISAVIPSSTTLDVQVDNGTIYKLVAGSSGYLLNGFFIPFKTRLKATCSKNIGTATYVIYALA